MAKKQTITSLFSVIAFLLTMMFCVNASAEGIKIGFINTARVLDESPQADAARQRIEKEFSPRDKEIVAAQKDVLKLEEKLNRDSAIMSETERRRLEKDVLTQKRDLKRASEEAREDFNIRRNEEFDKIRRLVREVIVEIAEKQKFDLILEAGVVFASDKINITDQVVEQLKKQSTASTSKK